MHVPKLLKKLSRRSLKGHDSEAESESETPPALPHDSVQLRRFPSDSPRPSSEWAHPVNRSLSTGMLALPDTAESGHRADRADSGYSTADSGYAASLPAHSRQASQNASANNPHARISYAPPSGSPPPRSRTTSYSSSNRASYFVLEGDPRGKAYSPSQLGSLPPTVIGRQLTASPTPQTPEQRHIPDDDLSRSLAGAWEVANTAPKTSKADKVLLVAENNFIQGQAKEGQVAAFATGLWRV
ncbi:hypothetical protein B0H17DRAFT_480450 [Mycena rosella]|uniref:Uncharacterized protein n=1 Tax=Mycena rosella TaxID=1033263 RepID=A0AAD7DMM0_MYCRO|nr:hypothetical protein B0H17DRAFT_480450 [Mycena rosella]